MNILVCISVVPDTTTKVKFADDNTRLDTTGVQWVINPWDELSLTRALELKDDALSGVKQVSIAHVGTASSEPTLRKALAMGADNAYRVNAELNDAFQVAAGLAEVVKAGQFDMILCGIESSDYNGSNVGSMLAELLDLPSVSAISSLKVENGQAQIIREIDGGKEVVGVASPFVGIVQKGIAKEPRIASMRGIMQARTKPIQVMEAPSAEAVTRVIRFEPPQPRANCKFIDPDHAKELIALLQNEAKLL
ncbi:MAG: electron transfer flavoprotein subunit beta/FixA family protein [Bacteroides sp.]|jgi:electron transfer flavoprotein beta subunit|nr:electron transfer flavoprotein subunit beta/FixA family protein [Bacteroides sp.]